MFGCDWGWGYDESVGEWRLTGGNGGDGLGDQGGGWGGAECCKLCDWLEGKG